MATLKKKMAKRGKSAKAPKSELEHLIEQLEFYNECYTRSAMQTLSFALPQLVNQVRGSSAKIGRALGLLEQVAFETELRIDALKAELKKHTAKEGK